MDDWNFNFWCIVVKSWLFFSWDRSDSIPLKLMRKKNHDFVAGVHIAGRFQQMCRFQPGNPKKSNLRQSIFGFCPSKSHREKFPPLKPHIFRCLFPFWDGCCLAGANCWLVSAEFCFSSVVTVVLAAKLHQNWYGIYTLYSCYLVGGRNPAPPRTWDV